MRYSIADLKEIGVVRSSHTSDLHIETEDTRVWLSRCTVADGEPYNNRVTVERYVNGEWRVSDEYQAE